jgi:hypothetical protein
MKRTARTGSLKFNVLDFCLAISSSISLVPLFPSCLSPLSQRITLIRLQMSFFYCEKIVNTKKGLVNAHPALCSTVL